MRETRTSVDRSLTDNDEFWLGKETHNSLQEHNLSDFLLDGQDCLIPCHAFKSKRSLEIDDDWTANKGMG